jgi:hypothetical protein
MHTKHATRDFHYEHSTDIRFESHAYGAARRQQGTVEPNESARSKILVRRALKFVPTQGAARKIISDGDDD